MATRSPERAWARASVQPQISRVGAQLGRRSRSIATDAFASHSWRT